MSSLNQQPKINILFGNCAGSFNEVYGKVIQDRFKDRFEFTFIGMSKPDIEELLQPATIHDIHLFILILNNIRITNIPDSIPVHEEKILDLIKYLKYIYRKPVIALYGWDFEDPEIEIKSIAAGADFYFPLPTDSDELIDAVQTCLERTIKFRL